MSYGGWGYNNSWKGRCSKCRWSFFRGERYCTSCGGWVRYPTQSSGEDKGVQPTQGKAPPTLPLPSKQQQNAAALQHQPQQGNGRTAWATPKGTPKAGSGRATAQTQPGATTTSTQPGGLEKITASRPQSSESSTRRLSGPKKHGKQPKRRFSERTHPHSKSRYTPPRKILAGCRRR